LEKIEQILRKEVERADRLSAFLVCMSLAGGTGSGVGSYYTEVLRDEYPRTCIVNSCVWPFSTGEVILQNYNFLLTLNKL
jgi:tubulin delta